MDVNKGSEVIYENHNICGPANDSSVSYENSITFGKVRATERSSAGINKNPNGEKKAGKMIAHSGFSVLLVCLGILCVLLIGGVIWVSVTDTECETRLGKKALELATEKENVKNLTDQLSRERDNLSQTLKFVLTFNNFTTNNFCPNKTCQLCQTGWILFQGKCYLFYKKASPWDQSREYCQDRSADLVVIDNLQEQEFVSNHSQYYGQSLGYWLGLQLINNKWMWVNGHENNLMYWKQMSYGIWGTSAVLIPTPDDTQNNWYINPSGWSRRFICERDALIIPNQISQIFA